ncbi:MAG: cytochrome c oxidase subunit II [Kamptonema sp. SIO1D9]|nr:cytochrome c oxidase subunit II [Kamptonema sp. SIO1D9]
MDEKEKIPVSLLTLTAGIVVTLVSFWVGQNHGLMPEQASQQAPLVDKFFSVMMTIGTALFLVVEGAIVIAVIRFRHRKGDDTDAAPIIGNLPLEAFWTAIPAIIVIGLGIYSVEVYRDMGGFDPATGHTMAHHQPTVQVAYLPESNLSGGLIAQTENTEPKKIYGFGATPDTETTPADLVVNVTGIQFAWLFNYPESGIMAGELHVPLGADVQLNIAAQDVIHSFWVPQFRLKQDAIPGQNTELRFVATKTGTYPIVCAELCGGYHGAMRTQLIVDTPEAYQAWVAENQIAQAENRDRAIALNPHNLSVSEFLAPYTETLGINQHALAQIKAEAIAQF